MNADDLVIYVPKSAQPPTPPAWHAWVYGGARNPLKDIKYQPSKNGLEPAQLDNHPASAPLRLVTPPRSVQNG